MAAHPYDSLALDTLHTRTNAKWARYGSDILPLWVAEMDFPLATPIKDAIAAQTDCDNLGYTLSPGLPQLLPALRTRLSSRYDLKIEDEHVMQLSGTVQGLYLAAMALAGPGDEVLLLTPLYPPFRMTVEATGRVPVEVEMHLAENGYELDMDALEAAVTPATRILMLCNPHNPSGRVMRRDELEALAAFALRHNLWIVSDELHADLVLTGTHMCIAALSEEVAQRSVTLYGPTKAFNIPGLRISFALSHNTEILKRFARIGKGIASGPNILGQAATAAAYRDGDAWLEETLHYLRGNRERLVERVAERLPQVRMHAPEGTYLAWLDFRATSIGDDPAAALLERAKIALNKGDEYGAGGHGFVRLNFATSRAILETCIDGISAVLAEG